MIYFVVCLIIELKLWENFCHFSLAHERRRAAVASLCLKDNVCELKWQNSSCDVILSPWHVNNQNAITQQN